MKEKIALAVIVAALFGFTGVAQSMEHEAEETPTDVGGVPTGEPVTEMESTPEEPGPEGKEAEPDVGGVPTTGVQETQAPEAPGPEEAEVEPDVGGAPTGGVQEMKVPE